MIIRTLAAFLLLSSLSGCTYWRKVPLTGIGHPSGWSDQIRERAVEAYSYAQMSLNAYCDTEDRYDLGPDLINVRNADNDEAGFAYSIFERRSNGRLDEVIIAFRGTELGDTRDMYQGNAAGRQNPRGLALYDEIAARPEYASVPITVTGHSLGGGIATHVSLQRDGADAYIFNSSPRFWRRGPIAENDRLSIVEQGELLKIFRMPGREAPQTYISINCVPGVAPLTQHGIRLLGNCLTRIAAWHDEKARASLIRNNIEWPSGLPSDPRPVAGARRTEPCEFGGAI